MSVLVGMGRIDDAYTEANVQSDNYINELENELEQSNDALGEEMTKNSLLFVPFEQNVKFGKVEKPKAEVMAVSITYNKLTLKEKAGFVLQAIKEAFYKTFK